MNVLLATPVIIGEKDKPVLVLALERSKRKDHAVVAHPRSYEEAISSARKAFDIAQDKTIHLRLPMKRVDGCAHHWGRIIPEEWSRVVRPNVDEIGVFVEEPKSIWNIMEYSRMKVLNVKKQIGTAQYAGYEIIPEEGEDEREKEDGPSISNRVNAQMHFVVKYSNYKLAHGTRHAIPLPRTYEECQQAIRETLRATYPNAEAWLPKPSFNDINEPARLFRLTGKYDSSSGSDSAISVVLTVSSSEMFIAMHSEGHIPVVAVAWP